MNLGEHAALPGGYQTGRLTYSAGAYSVAFNLGGRRTSGGCALGSRGVAFPPEVRRGDLYDQRDRVANARFRQATRRRGHFPNEQAALKVLYLVIRTPPKNRANVTGGTPGWKAALNPLTMYYGDRINLS